MNINVNNQSDRALELYLQNITEEQFKKYYISRQLIHKLLNDNKTALPLTDDKKIRGIFSKLFKYNSFDNIIDLSLLLVLGLNKITANHLVISEKAVLKQLVNENIDNTYNYITDRILSQIHNKLPVSIQPMFSIRTRLRLLKYMEGMMEFNKISEMINKYTGENVVEPFVVLDEINNTDMSQYNNFLKEIQEVYGEDVVTNFKENGYDLKQIHRQLFMETDAGDYKEQEQKYLNTVLKLQDTDKSIATNNIVPQNILNAEYINSEPVILQDAKTGEYFFHDKLSDSLIGINNVSKRDLDSLTEEELDDLLKKHKLTKKDIKKHIPKVYRSKKDKNDNTKYKNDNNNKQNINVKIGHNTLNNSNDINTNKNNENNSNNNNDANINNNNNTNITNINNENINNNDANSNNNNNNNNTTTNNKKKLNNTINSNNKILNVAKHVNTINIVLYTLSGISTILFIFFIIYYLSKHK